ncbi:restriction endonuclease subunit S [Campylobacter coli]
MKNFKDSGIEWIGEIPQHWKLIKCKNFFILKSVPIGDLWNKTKLLSLTLNGVIERDINNPEGKFPSDFSTYQIVKEGDLIFCLFDVAETPRTIGLSKLNGMITSAYTIFEIKNQEKRFLEYFFINLDNRKNLKFLYRGLRNTISKEDLLNLKIPLPPLKEQEQIANFLDEKCEQIANFIEKKEKLISLLKEQKQVLINETITKGLDKNVNFKDSGIEWLGEIPQHWEIVKLKYLGNFQNGISINSEAFGVGYPFVSYGDVYNNISIPFNVKGLVNSTEIDRKVYSVKQGDIFFTRTSETIDEIGISSVCLKTIENAVFAGFLIRFRANKKILDNNFAKFYFRRNLNQYFFAKENGLVTRASLGQELLGKLPVIIPPLKEQKQIANFLDEKCEKIDLLIEKTKKQIKLIKEYKTTLINQAVCGRIDL